MKAWRQRLEAGIIRAWYEGAGWLWCLWPLSVLVTWVARRRRAQLAAALPLRSPVIIVGGITVGGTGKTPVLIALVEALQEKGMRVGVVSRGYGSSAGAGPLRVEARSTARAVGDEPLLIALRTQAPVLVGRNRWQAAKMLLDTTDVDVVVADDGLQHYALPRDFEIAVIDAQRGLGNRRVLPMGPLREPPERLAAVDWILERNGSDPDSAFHYRQHHLLHWQTRRVLAFDAASREWQPVKLAAATALGQPEQFFASLDVVGLDFESHSFPDHHPLSRQDLDAIAADIIIITEKDAVKIDAFDDARIWVLVISAQLPAALIARLQQRLASEGGARCTT